MPTWLIILITVLRTLKTGAIITIFLYCRCKNATSHSKTSSIFWPKENPKETTMMFTNSSQQSIGCSKINSTPDMVKKDNKC